MSVFDDREKGYERKFQQDQELAFKVKAHRNRLLALWAAQQLHLSGDSAEAYASTVIDAELKGGDDGVVAKIVKDFGAKGVAFDAARVRLELDRFAGQARKQLKAT